MLARAYQQPDGSQRQRRTSESSSLENTNRGKLRIQPIVIGQPVAAYLRLPAPQLSSSFIMASTLLRRQLARISHLAPRRCISTSSSLHQQTESRGAYTPEGKHVFDTHTVEDLHGMAAKDILAETGSRKESQMRHFTGKFYLPQRYRYSSLLSQSISGKYRK